MTSASPDSSNLNEVWEKQRDWCWSKLNKLRRNLMGERGLVLVETIGIKTWFGEKGRICANPDKINLSAVWEREGGRIGSSPNEKNCDMVREMGKGLMLDKMKK